MAMKKPSIFMMIALSVFATLANADVIGVGKLPKINSIARHEIQGTKFFAATNEGLFVSEDNGQTWTVSSDLRLPATMVTATAGGTLYAFVVTRGLLRFNNEENRWQPVSNQLGAQVLVQLSAEFKAPTKLVALNQFGRLIVSDDAGINWHGIRGRYAARNANERRGQSLYRKNCQSCHGIEGVGETYNLQALTDKNYLRAPAMDYSEHAWHHTDEALEKTILEGSPRSERMMAWKNAGLTKQDAQNLIAYIKSLWTQRELDCQGPKHMQCMN
jgi:mono/diheme cytochrome c family protein